MEHATLLFLFLNALQLELEWGMIIYVYYLNGRSYAITHSKRKLVKTSLEPILAPEHDILAANE